MSHDQSLSIAFEVLDGLSVGDALGEACSYQSYNVRELLPRLEQQREGSLRYTDDTAMAIAIVESLKLMRTIDEDALSWAFGRHYRFDPDRGYGKMARRLLNAIADGVSWLEVSPAAFGTGSFGNGSAMRVAPIGGYFANNLDQIVAAATRSARVTHFHPEGIAGAVAVAVATGVAASQRNESLEAAQQQIRRAVLTHTPEGSTHTGLRNAFECDYSTPAIDVAKLVGNGIQISSQDTVPFCLWNASRCLDDYEEAIISTIEVGGDCDTNGAIVGGVVAAFSGREGIPANWLNQREVLKFLSQCSALADTNVPPIR